MGIKKDDLKGLEPVPAGLYKVRFIKFDVKAAKLKVGEASWTSVNLNPIVEILEHPELNFKDGKPRTLKCLSLNSKLGGFINDFVHSFGLEMEDQLGENPQIPGMFDKTPSFDATKPETWIYEGPLTGRTAEWDVVVGSYNNRPNNQINRMICKVPDCATKFPVIQHAQNMFKP